MMQPVDHFEMFIEIDALQRRHPRLENLEPANRTAMAPLPRRILARGPGRTDTADEDEASVTGWRHLDGELALTNFTFSNHVSIQ
ncbi:hypothetical protein GALL_516650 [mine drainage metagenome]|uniref:Uncharacterized protein n=1 Tax=mine drainage metagenome TaxID=410659 RepID=A0A1J5P6C6_9ZZZZ